MNTSFVKRLLSLAIFVAVGAAIFFGNEHYTDFSQQANIGIALVGGLVSSIAFVFLTRPRTGGTGSTTSSTSSARPAARGNGGDKRSHLPLQSDVMVQLATGRDPSQPVKERREPKPRTVENATFTIGDVEGKKVVTVKVAGTTGAQFKKKGGAHDRIVSVSGVKWAHPKNVPADKACSVSGVVSDEASVRAGLEKLGVTAA